MPSVANLADTQYGITDLQAPGRPNYVEIRGRRLDLGSLVDEKLHEPQYLKDLRDRLGSAAPFPHLVVDGWFAAELLESVNEEFETARQHALTSVQTSHEATYRTPLGAHLGPATQLYFGIVHSGWFVDALSSLCGIDQLIPDVSLLGGGMHETKAGGSFDVHRDFDRHPFTGLRNELVMITYLNAKWDPAWQGSLELWDSADGGAVRRVVPEFGRTLLMRRTANSYHGHPQPLASPQGRPRRSLACYYYSNPRMDQDRLLREGTTYLVPDGSDRLRDLARSLLPPLIYSRLRRLMRR